MGIHQFLLHIYLKELDLEGRSALHVAVAYRQVETVRYLVESVENGGAGVDPNQKTSFGSTAYEAAVQRQLPKIIAVLQPRSALAIG